MSGRTQHESDEELPPASELLAELDSGKPVRRDLAGGFRIHLDRAVPFMCVYRRPGGDDGHVGLNRLTACQTASVMSVGHPRDAWRSLVSEIGAEMTKRFGGFLVVEFWELDEERATPPAGETLAAPEFKMLTEAPPTDAQEMMESCLMDLRIGGMPARQVRKEPLDLGQGVFFGRGGMSVGEWIGLGISPIYRDADTGRLFPRVLAELELALREVLLRTFEVFCRSQTTLAPAHFHVLGRRHFVDEVKSADRHLERVAASFSFLLMVTPENSGQAWDEFKQTRFKKLPRFVYRPLDIDPEILKRRLYDVDIEKIEDPTISQIFREKQLELERQISMLHERRTENFLYGSLMVYGGVEPELYAAARMILAAPLKRGRKRKGRKRDKRAKSKLCAASLRLMAEAEVAGYHRRDRTFTAKVMIRHDIPPGMLVDRGELLISSESSVPARRADALLHHEIGTHLVTYFNGRHQRLRQMKLGLAGYEGFQEGIAVMAEYAVGGLTGGRLRTLAARVVACRRLLEGAGFLETFHELVDEYHFRKRAAFTLTNRIYRGGGLTKDAIYLRGFIEVCDYLSDGGALEPLFVGKIARRHLPQIEELMHRGILSAPAVMPRYLEQNPGAAQRLQKLRGRLSLKELCEELEPHKT